MFSLGRALYFTSGISRSLIAKRFLGADANSKANFSATCGTIAPDEIPIDYSLLPVKDWVT